MRNPQKIPDRKHLYEKYVNEKLTLEDIGHVYGCSGVTVYRWMNKLNIKRRTSKEFMKGKKNNLGHKMSEETRRRMSMSQVVAQKKRTSNKNYIPPWLGKHHSKTAKRKMSESKKGDKNPRWKGGASEYPNHSLMKKLREKLFKELNNRCQICNKEAQDIHHIDFSRHNHSLENLTILCRSCHKKLHFRNRGKRGIDKQRFGCRIKAIE